MSIDPQDDADWLDIALLSHDKIPFYALLLTQSLIDACDHDCDEFVEFLGSLDSKQWEGRRKRTLTLTKSAESYKSALTPILRYAKSIALIDPWLNSQESRYFDTVSTCSNLLGRRETARYHGRIDIHAEAGKQKPTGLSVADYFSAWERKLRPLTKADGHRFRIFLWESLPGSESMHDRYILTDQCGLSVPGGLDCRTHSHANSTDWSLLDEDARQHRLSDYAHPGSPFDLVDDYEISH